MELQAIVLAAGRGSHMVELTNKLAKPLLPVGNKPLIFYPLNMLEKVGFQKVIVITLSSLRSSVDLILKSFKMTSTLITIDDDSDLDTLDSLRLVKDYVKTDMLVISCDFICDISLRQLVDVHKLHDSSITMLLSTHQPQLDNAPGTKPRKKGEIQPKDFIGLSQTDEVSHRLMFLLNEADLEDDNLSVRMKVARNFPRIEVRTNLRDAHVYVMKRWVLDYIVHNPSKSSLRSELLPYIVHKQFSENKISEKNVDRRLDSVDTNDGKNPKDVYSYLNEDKEKDFIYKLSSSKNTFSRCSKELSCYAYIYDQGILFNANNIAAYVEANRMIGGDCLVGDRSLIGEKSSIKRSVVGRDCKIGSYVRISNCVLMDRVVVENGCNLQGSVFAESVVVGEKSAVTDSLIGFYKVLPNLTKLSRESVVESEMMEFE